MIETLNEANSLEQRDRFSTQWAAVNILCGLLFYLCLYILIGFSKGTSLSKIADGLFVGCLGLLTGYLQAIPLSGLYKRCPSLKFYWAIATATGYLIWATLLWLFLPLTGKISAIPQMILVLVAIATIIPGVAINTCQYYSLQRAIACKLRPIHRWLFTQITSLFLAIAIPFLTITLVTAFIHIADPKELDGPVGVIFFLMFSVPLWLVLNIICIPPALSLSRRGLLANLRPLATRP